QKSDIPKSGNTRVPHCVVLHNDNNFSTDELQKITHSLCHLYCRCETAVSLGIFENAADLFEYGPSNTDKQQMMISFDIRV
nr:plastid lipid-associated protein/fibrillin conserved domain-containing protein [Tanacetum cinerariifolium]